MAIIRQRRFIEPALDDQTSDIQQIYGIATDKHITTCPFDVKGYIESQGIKVISEDMGSEISGYIEFRINHWVIAVNRYQNPRRQRFTLAHEYAHFLYDRETIQRDGKIVDVLLFRSDESNEIEKRANQFAGELLMPTTDFLNAVENGMKDFQQLADKFNVSVAAIRYRAFKLKLINAY